MKKIITVWVLTIIFFSLLTSCVLAHSGRTDSDGGHWNHSNGTYHWHHGYSAHQHEDRDMDGSKEWCPYRDIENDNNFEKGFSLNISWKTILGWGFGLLLVSPIILAIVLQMWCRVIEPVFLWIKDKITKK